MFTIDLSSSYSWPVKLEIPSDGGVFKEHTFDAIFKRISQSKLKALLNVQDMTDFNFCKEILIGWKGIVDDKGAEIPFSETARDTLLDIAAAANTIAEAFMLSASRDGAKRKN